MVNLNGAVSMVNTNSMSLTGLNVNTRYDLFISSVADNWDPCCTARESFRTACGTMNPPMEESFDDYGIGYNVMPTCWTKLLNYDDTLNEPQIVGNPFSSSPGALRMYCGSNDDGNHYSMAIGPRMNVSDIASLSVRLSLRAAYSGTYLIVGVCDSTLRSNNNFTPVDTITINAVNTWEEKVVNLASYAGSGKYVAFRMQRSLQSGNGRYLFIDDVALLPCGVLDERLYDRTYNSMWLAFDTFGSPVVNIEYGPAGFADGTGIAVNAITSPYRLTGLRSATEYEVRLHPVCQSGGADEDRSIRLATLAPPHNRLNLCYDFDSNSSIPADFIVAETYNGTPSISNGQHYSGNYSLRMLGYNYDRHSMLVFPAVDTVDVNSLSLSFALNGNGRSQIVVGVMEYPERPDSFVPVDTIQTSGGWQHVTVPLSRYSGSGRYLALWCWYDNAYIDNVELSQCALGSVRVTDVTNRSVRITWDTPDTGWHGSSATIEYGGAGFVLGSGTRLTVNPAAGSTTITRLAADSTYDFVVYGNCDTMVQHCGLNRYTVHTLDSQLQPAYCEGFEQYTSNEYPFGWTRPQTYESRPRVSNNRAHNGSNSLDLYSYTYYNNHAMAVLPMIETSDLGDLYVGFWYNGSTNGSHDDYYLELGVVESPYDPSSFTAVARYPLVNGQWQRGVADFASYTGSGHNIAFRCVGTRGAECWIDDISVNTCQLRNITETALTSHSVAISWTLAGSGTGATIEYGPQGFQLGSGTRVSVSDSSYTIDGLAADTPYDYYIWGNCTDDSGYCTFDQYTFRTLPVATVATWCNNWESCAAGGVPSGMYRPLVFDNFPRVTQEGNPGRCITFRAYKHYYSDSGYSMLVLPLLEESDLSGLTLNFDLRKAYSDANSHLTIGFMTNPFDTTTFEPVFDTNPVNTGWRRFSVPLSSYSGAGRYIAIYYHYLPSQNNHYNDYTYIDNLTIERCHVEEVYLYSVTTHDAWLSWTEVGGADSVEVEYGIEGSPNTTIVTNAISPLHIEGLEPSSTYRYYVRPHCAGSSQVCSNYDYTFETRADSIVSGYCEGFDAMPYGQVPLHWTRLKEYSNYPRVIESGSAEYHTSYARSVAFYTCSGSGNGNFVVMPAADSAVGGGVVSFQLRCTSSDVRGRAILTVGVMTLPYDSTTFVPIATIRPTYQWHRYTVDFAPYTGTGRHIAFRYQSLDGCFNSYLDDLGFSRCRLGELNATGVTDQSVRLSWRQYGQRGTGARYTIEYGESGFSRGNGTMVHTTDTTLLISGLNNNTSYQFFVWSSCQDSNRCQEESVAIRTLDQPIETPYCTNFAGEAVGTLPGGWTRCFGDVYPRISSDRSREASRAIQFYAYRCNNWSDQECMAAMPIVDPVQGLQLDFYYYNENSNAWLEVGVITNPHDSNGFVPLHTVRRSGGWVRVKLSLAGYSGNGHYVAFRYKAAYCSSGYAYIDNLTLRRCAITSCRLANLGQEGVDVIWNATTGTPGVWMSYGTSAGSLSTPTFHTFSPIHIAGLAEATQFVVRLWPQCDSLADNCNYEELHEETLHTWVNIPYCTNFDGLASNGFPNNWRRHSTAGSNYPAASVNVRHSENYSLRFYATDSLFSQAAMPTTNPNSGCVAANGLYVNFWTYFSGNTQQGRLVVGVMSDILDTNSFVGVDTISAISSTWEHHTVSLTPYSGTGRIIAFRFLSANGWWSECYVDDLCIEKCVASDLTITDITQNSITVSWTGQSTRGMVVEYGPRGFAHGHGIFDTLTNSPATIDGLTELTEYEFNFMSLCQCQMIGATYLPGGGSTGSTSGDGSWSGGGTGGGGGWGGGTGIIITTQAHYLEIPYCESFDQYDSLNYPTGYRRIVGSSHLYPALTTNNSHSAESSIALYTTTDTACYMSLPPLEEGSIADMVMTFFAYSTNGYATSTDVLHVGVMSNPDDPATYDEVAALRLASTARWQQLSVDFSGYTGSGQYITFRFKPLYNSYTYYIDDIYLGRCGVTNVQFSTSPTSVQVSWTPLHNPSGVTIQYGRQGFADDSSYVPTTATAISSPYTIAGIDPDSNYDFYLMAQCSDTDFALCTPVHYTLNPMLYPPYCEDFEGIPNGVVPTGWKVLRGRGQYPLSETRHGQQVMAFYPCINEENMVLMRPLPSLDSLNGKWVYANFSSSYSNYIYLDFGTVADTSDYSTFVQMASLSNGQNESLREFNVQLTGDSFSSSYNRFAIRARSTSGCHWIRLAKLALANYPYPTQLNSTVYGSSCRRITWSGEYANPYYRVEYGYSDHWYTLNSDSCEVMLTNLDPGQAYQVYFISPQGERLCLPYTFTTPEAVGLPYCEDFDSYDNLAVPTGWYSYSSYGDSYPRTRNSCYNSCCHTLDFYCNYDHLQYTALPDFAIDSIRHLELRFSLRIENVSCTRLVVGVLTDRSDFTTFTPVDTLTCPTSSIHYPQHISLASYRGSGRFVAFRILTTCGRTSLFIDDLQVSACPLPDFTVAGAHGVKATLSTPGLPDYWVEYGPQGCRLGDTTNTIMHITQNPYLIAQLDGGMAYSFYARCDSANHTCVQLVGLTTSLELPLPYCNNFDTCPNGQLPMGWTRINPYHSGYPMRNSNGHIQFYSNCVSGSRSYAVMPDLIIDSISQAELYMNVWSESNNLFMLVGIMSDPSDEATFVAVDTLKPPSTGYWQPMHVSLRGCRGDGRFVAFCFVNPYGNCSSMYVDDLSVDRIPQPELALVGATRVRAVVPGGGPVNYWIEYGPDGSAQGDSTNYWQHVTTDTVYITDLDELTTYHFYHHHDSGYVSCLQSQSITTSAMVSMPYCEDFEHFEVSSLSEGWTSEYECNRTDELAHVLYIGYSWATSSALDLTGYCWQWIRMPAVDLDGHADVQLSFRMGVNGYYDRQYIVVGLLSNRLDYGTFVPTDTLQCTANSVYQYQTVHLHGLDGDVANIAFRYLNTVGSYSMYIDDIVVSFLPEPQIGLVSHNTISIQTDTSYPMSQYWVRITNADGLDSMVYVDSNPFYIQGLQILTTYTLTTYLDSVTPSCYPPQTVTTSRLQTVPYCEPFASYGTGTAGFPTGWRRHLTNGDANRLYIYNDSDAEDYRTLRFDIRNGYYAYAVLPELDAPSVNDLTLRVRMWSQSGPDPATHFLEVGVMTFMDDTCTFQVVDTLRNIASGTWEYLTAHFSSYAGSGRFIALRMKEIAGSWRQIYLDRLEVLDCDIPASVRVSLNRHDVVRIDAPEASSTGFWAEYGRTGFTPGTGTFAHVQTLPTDFMLDNNTTYDFYFYCDTLTPTCIPKQTITTLPPPLSLPLCFDFDTCRNNYMPYAWHNLRVPQAANNDCYVYNDQSHTLSRSLRFCSYHIERHPYAVLPDLQVDSLNDLAVSFWMRNDNYGTFILDLGVMSDPYDPSSFITIKRFTNTQNNTWQRMQAVLTDAPADAHFVAFRLTKTNNYSWSGLYLDDLYIAPCGGADLRVAALDADHITLDWNQAGNPDIDLEYGPVGFISGMGTQLHPTAPPLVINGLNNLTNYEFRFCATCSTSSTGYCQTNYCDTLTLFTPAGGTGCIDPTNLTADYTTCTHGSYSNPRSQMGILDYGPQSPLSRHTVHYDTTERDPRTSGLLRTIPPGAESAVRLGNWTSNPSQPEAESITYSLFVDPASFDLLILRYAAVLQDPEHSPAQQPRFSIEILDETNNVIDSRCGAADFIANAQLGWNDAPNDVLWKDWTTVGIDMSAYANQTVRLRLTTYDCGEGSHYGYAYFTLGCLLKNIIAEHCGDVAANTYTMPDGFAYNWYVDTVTKATLFNTQTITIPTANTTYYCDLSFIDDTSCSFTMSAYAGTRYPLALFDSTVTITNCQFHVQFNNHSTISNDGFTPIGTGEGCEAAFWDFGNGYTSTEYNGSTIYTTPGTYRVMLVSYIGGGTCTDTIIKTLVLEYPSASPSLIGPSERCFDAPADTLWVFNGISYLWSSADTVDFLPIAPTADTDYWCVVTSADGCVDTFWHPVTVHPVFHLYDTAAICDVQLPYSWRDTLFSTGTSTGSYLLSRSSSFGCDSLMQLQLFVNHASSGDTLASACDSLIWYGATYTSTPSILPTHILTNSYGCDSILTLHLSVHYSSHTTSYDTISQNQLPYTYLSHQLISDTTVIDSLSNVEGCDSVVTYHLHVLRNNDSIVDSIVCDDQLPLTWNHRTFMHAGTQYDTLTNQFGADSLLTMVLHVLPTYRLDFYDTICSNQTFVFDGRSYTAAGSYTDSLHTLSSPSCDSLRTLHLTVFPTTQGDTAAVVCDQFLWYDSVYTASTTDTLAGIYTNAQRCDSTVVLHLTVNHSTAAAYYDTCTENQLPRSYHSLTAHGDTANAVLMLTNATGCDSVVTYHLHVLRNNDSIVDSTVCDDQLPLTWNHRTFMHAGTQYDTLTNQFGADSLLTMVLHVLPTYRLDFYDTICSNQTFVFDGRSYTAAGSYTDSLHTLSSPSCDSLRTLNLTVFPTTQGDTAAVACDQFLWHDSLYTVGTQTPTYLTQNIYGCDSAVTLSLTIHHSDYQQDYDTICQNSLAAGYVWRDTVLYSPSTSSGIYSLLRHNQWDCDSNMVLHLVVHDDTYGSVFDTIVQNQAATWVYNGVAIDHDTAQMMLTLSNQWGCDSVVNYNLHVWSNVSVVVDSSICASETDNFEWQGMSYADTLRHTFADIHGADSSVTLLMHSMPSYHVQDYDTICSGTPYVWGDSSYAQSGSYTHHFLTVLGCDSTATLHLLVNPIYEYHYFDTIYYGDTVCFEGEAYSAAGSYTHRYVSTLGCDSASTLHLVTITLVEVRHTDSICEGDTLHFGGRRLTFPGEYRDTLHSTNSVMGDTVVVETLVVLPYPTVGIHMSYQCRPTPYYTLTAHTEADYLQWVSAPYDNGIDHHEHDSVLYLSPVEPTVYYLFADYGDTLLCPASDSVTLTPIEPIEAVIGLTPDYLTYDRRHLEARSVGGGHYNYVRWGVQYYQGAFISDTSRVLRLDVPTDIDSLMIILNVANEHCADTDSAMVPAIVTGLFFPNVFTPSLETNNQFSGIGVGIDQFEMWIYDRRGALLYHSTDLGEVWNGTFEGKKCPQATYVYHCEYTTKLEPNSLQTKTGTVTLLR